MGKMFSELEISLCDPVKGEFLFNTPTGEMNVTHKDGHTEISRWGFDVGKIVPGSDHSGAIWIGENCIGEYSFKNGGYLVTPYKNGSVQKDKREEIHPLDYFYRELMKNNH